MNDVNGEIAQAIHSVWDRQLSAQQPAAVIPERHPLRAVS